jgi:hypothetical protein
VTAIIMIMPVIRLRTAKIMDQDRRGVAAPGSR